MGFAVVHMMKIGKGGVRGIQSHNQREKDPHTNPDINKARTKDNYELLGKNMKNYHREIKDRIARLAIKTKTVRKDAVILCNFIITSDEQTMKAMPLERQREFFQDAVKFFGERYGADRLVNATVHMDETTPHMHIGLVPITADGRLAAKSIFTKSELQNLQTDFAREVGERYGLERGIEGSQRIHLSEQQFKAKEAREQVQEAQKELQRIKDRLPPLKAEYEARKAYVEAMSNDFDLLSGVEEQKNILGRPTGQVLVPKSKWETQAVTQMDREAQKKADQRFEKNVEAFKNTGSVLALEKRCNDLEKDCASLKAANRKLTHELHNAEAKVQNAEARLNRVIGKLPKNIADAFVHAWAQDKKQIEREEERGSV